MHLKMHKLIHLKNYPYQDVVLLCASRCSIDIHIDIYNNTTSQYILLTLALTITTIYNINETNGNNVTQQSIRVT